MKIIIIFLLTLFSFTKNNNVYYLPLNTEYEIELSNITDYIIPSKTSHYFKIPVEKDSNLEIQLKVFRGAIEIFKIVACGFEENPSEEEIIKGNNNCYNYQKYSSISQYDIFDIYKYPIEKFENAKYISIHLYNLYSLDYLTIYAYSYKQGIKFTLYDVSYMEEFELKNETLKKHEGVFFFRYKNDHGLINSIKFKISNQISSELVVKVAGFRDEPKTTDDFDYYIDSYEPKLNSVTKEVKYSIYEYAYQKIEGTGYILVGLIINEKIDYLSVYIS